MVRQWQSFFYDIDCETDFKLSRQTFNSLAEACGGNRGMMVPKEGV